MGKRGRKKASKLSLGRCAVTEGGKRCPFPVYVAKHGLCVGHYKRLVRLGVVGGLLRKRRKLTVPSTGVPEEITA